MFVWNRGLFVVVVGLLATPALAQGPVHTPRVHALTGVRIWQGPGRVIENGTIVIRDGVIEEVGASVTVPADARVWELDSLTVYPGLIDLGMVQKAGGTGGGRGGGESREGEEEEEKKEAGGSLGHELDVVTPEKILADELALKDGDRKARRAQGITTARVLPGAGSFRGQATVANLGDGDLRKNLLERSAGQVLAFTSARGRGDYPRSTMGVVAVMRQTFYDTRWYQEAQEAYEANPVGTARPPVSISFEALAPAMDGKTPLIFLTRNVLDLLRADEMGQEFGLRFEYLGSGEEYKRIGEIKGVVRNLVIPVNFPEAPGVDDPGKALGVSLEKLRAWDDAPTNPFQLHEAGIPFALTANGLKDVGQFRKNVRRAIEAGLPEEAALAAVTTVPAEMIGMDDRLGSVDAGKIANLVVVDGDFFAEKTKVRSVWIDGDHYEVEEVKPPEGDPRGTWDLLADAEDGQYPFTLVLGGEVGSLTASITFMETEIEAEATQSGSSVIVSFSGDSIGMPGMLRFSFEFQEDNATGSGKTPDGESFTLSGTRTEKPTPSRGGSGQ